MAKTKFKQIRLKKVPSDIHGEIKSQAALADKTLEEWIIEILRKAADTKWSTR